MISHHQAACVGRRAAAVSAVLAAAVAMVAWSGPAAAAPRSVSCLTSVTLTYDDSRWTPKGDLPTAEGPCQLALAATPESAYSVQYMSLGGSPKDFKKLKKLKPAARIQLLADQLSGGSKAAPVQDVEPVGVFSMGFSVSQGPGGGTAASHIATAVVGSSLLYVVLVHRADSDPKAPAFDRSAARSELLGLLTSVRLGAAQGKK